KFQKLVSSLYILRRSQDFVFYSSQQIFYFSICLYLRCVPRFYHSSILYGVDIICLYLCATECSKRTKECWILVFIVVRVQLLSYTVRSYVHGFEKFHRNIKRYIRS